MVKIEIGIPSIDDLIQHTSAGIYLVRSCHNWEYIGRYTTILYGEPITLFFGHPTTKHRCKICRIRAYKIKEGMATTKNHEATLTCDELMVKDILT